MLLSFRAANHRSVRDEQQLLLTAQYPTDLAEATDWGAVPVAGIFGPNAAGKSNIIDALSYMQGMVRGSLKESEPGEGIERFPFALDPEMTTQPSAFVVDLLIAGIRYTYGFAVDDSQVIEEWLHSYPNRRKRQIFQREYDEYSYGENTPAAMQQVAAITDSNVLLLSVAARSKQELVQPVYSWFSRLHIRRSGHIVPISTRYGPMHPLLLNDGFRDRLAALLQAADTGIEGLEIAKQNDEEIVARVPKPDPLSELVFKHRGAKGDAILKLSDQSLGTRVLYDLAVPAMQTLDFGSVIAVDELDSSLHPYLSAKIIKLFGEPAANPEGAQLIFTSHDVSLLGRVQGEEVLHRDHIWFVEKNESGATELFPLSDFKPRKEENRERRYLTGRYGAVPIVHDELFAAALAARGDTRDEPAKARPEETATPESGNRSSP
jgi:hypothetical protein